jgi:hypothetical protein
MRVATLGLAVLASTGCLIAGSDKGRGGDDDDVGPPPPDGGDLTCADDSAFGNNDAISSAFVTPVELQSSSFFAFASICPPTDKDHYAVDILEFANLEVVVSWSSGDSLDLEILNAGGSPIGSGVPSADFMSLTACVPNLPGGRYFASVFSAGAFSQNNYNLDIRIVPSCN